MNYVQVDKKTYLVEHLWIRLVSVIWFVIMIFVAKNYYAGAAAAATEKKAKEDN
tara:strand:+ start:351 stop:512 length:162 start_codon:yes stop_codon:yes gene_type:complete